MNAHPLARTLLPLGLFLGSTGYLSWPYLTMEPEAAREKAKPATLDASVLHPDFRDPAPRNPFVGPPALRASKKGALEESNSAPPEAVDREPVGSWRLGATLVGGRNKAAVVDGRVYREGEFLLDKGGKAGPWKLAMVQAERILLTNRAGSRTLVVRFPERTYPDPKAKGNSRPTKPAQAVEQAGEDLLRELAGAGGNLPAELDPQRAILSKILGLGLGGN
ncbi:MAG: hypothetical protein U0800_05140 [Isosphaeraceae bacterium]